MDTPKNELRQRLREMLSVPERERTDAQWDEIIELEIRLAPGNQIDPNRSNEPVGSTQNFRPRPPNQGQPRQGQQRNKGRRPNKGQRGPGNPGGGNGGGNPPPSEQ
jgi:hypothetical protein